MHFIDTLEFASDSGLSYCTRCFDDEEYEQLQKIIKENHTRQKRNKSVLFEDETTGKKYRVLEENIDAFAKKYPDAITRQQHNGQKYFVRAEDYRTFLNLSEKW